MSQYLTDISSSLVRVLTEAVSARDDRIAGYAANLSFWADEVAHCLTAIEGFAARQETFAGALKGKIGQDRERTGYADPVKLRYGEATTRSQSASYRAEVSKLRRDVTIAAKGFFRKLHREKLITVEQWWGLEDRFPFLKSKS